MQRTLLLRTTLSSFSATARVSRPQQLSLVSVQSRRFLASAADGKKPKGEEAPLSPSFVEQYKLTDPTRWVPITVVGFGTAFATGLMHMNEEVQILGLFVLFVGTVYSQGGEMIAKMLDETAEAILKEHNAIEDAQIESTKQVIAAYKRQMDIANDIQTIFAAQSDLMAQVVAAQSLRLKHDVRNQIVKRLDNLVQAEGAVISGIQSSIIAKACSAARASFSEKGDAALKAKVLDAALLALESPKKPVGKDLVGELISNQFSAFRAKLEKTRGQELALSDADYASISDSVKAAARRDGLDHIPINVPRKYKLDGII